MLGIVDMNKEELKKDQKQELPMHFSYARKYLISKSKAQVSTVILS